jgi:hypothetical protein
MVNIPGPVRGQVFKAITRGNVQVLLVGMLGIADHRWEMDC